MAEMLSRLACAGTSKSSHCQQCSSPYHTVLDTGAKASAARRVIYDRHRHHLGTTLHECVCAWRPGDGTKATRYKGHVKSHEFRHTCRLLGTFIHFVYRIPRYLYALISRTSSNTLPRLRLLVILRIDASVPSRVLAVVAFKVHAQARRVLRKK